MRKLAVDGRPIDVSEHLPALLDRLRQEPGLLAVYLFGSYGTAHQTPLSDVDLALLFRRSGVPDFDRELELIGLATETLHEEDVSVSILNRAPLALQFKVIAGGRHLLVTDELAHADLVEEIVDRYCDFAIDERAFAREYDRTLSRTSPVAAVDRDKLRHHVQYVRQGLRQLRAIREEDKDAFADSPIVQAASVHYLQTAVEALLDIANHLIAREDLGTPRSYAEAVRILVEQRILPREHEETLLRMVCFRNRAVHLYDEIGPDEVFDILEAHLQDFDAFLAPIVERYLDRG